jgi:short subunit dehydrogenase-like uncharacterized protein
VLSGRDPEKLARFGDAPTKAVSLDDDGALRDLLEDAAVVINCAGPFTLAGDALVRAAIATGTHYVDSTGEQSFIQMVFERHGGAAERAGVALLPALGFDYAPATASPASLPAASSRSTSSCSPTRSRGSA